MFSFVLQLLICLELNNFFVNIKVAANVLFA